MLKLWISEHGKVDRVEVEMSNLDEAFSQGVARQFAAALFQPAEQDGSPVKSLMRIEVEILPRSRFSRNGAMESLPTP